MDKKILSRQELQYLQQFICARSARFAEPAVLLEILDHMACKTEELMEQDPALSFEQAVKRAHHSFGVRGFSPLADNCEKSMLQHYKRIFRQEQKSILRSLQGTGILLIGLLGIQSYDVLKRFGLPLHGLELILAIDAVFLFLFAAARYRLWRRSKKQRLPLAKAHEACGRVFLGIWGGTYLVLLQGHLPETLMMAFTGLFSVLLSFYAVAGVRLMRRVEKDIADTDQQLRIILQ